VERDYAEPPPPRDGAAYVREHDGCFAPMRRLFGLARQIATAITHAVSVFG
jgi:phosphoenolpyruvate carboxylase